MTAVRTPSQRAAASRRKGVTAERDLVRWLRSNGFPGAERAVRTGYRTADRTSADPGDITGTPLILWSVKDCAVERLDRWFDELDEMSDASGTYTQVGLIVHKRRGHADPARWWCWLSLSQLVDVYHSWLEQFDHIRQTEPIPMWDIDGVHTPIRMELGRLVVLLRAAGYGEPPAEGVSA